MKKNKLIQIIAGFALFSIILSLVWTGLLVIFWPKDTTTNNTTKKDFTPEEIKQIQDMIKAQSWSLTWTWTWTWETK